MFQKKEEKKEEREESLLKKLCGDDTKLYDLLSTSLYFHPIAAIPKEDLENLIEDAKKSIEDENYQEAMQKYRKAVDKALFEATQNLGERARYIKVIQDLTSRVAKVGEKVREKGEKEGFVSSSLEGRIKHYEFMSERIEDVIKIASLFYNEILEVQGAKERRDTRRTVRREADREEERAEKEAKEMREARRKGMGRAERREAKKEDKVEERKEKERGVERREEAIEAEREENRIDEREKERREAGRKEK
ncbi:hypothetical protein ACFL0D_00715 [Thermoproteota archaeon]